MQSRELQILHYRALALEETQFLLITTDILWSTPLAGQHFYFGDLVKM